jgi:hypothetical protein
LRDLPFLHPEIGSSTGIEEVAEEIQRVRFMHDAPRFFDDEICRLGSAENTFGAEVLHARNGWRRLNAS